MDLIIETLTGDSFGLKVNQSDTILSIKNRIQKRDGIPVTNQFLVWNDQELSDFRSITDYAITSGSKLKLILKLIGGPMSSSYGLSKLTSLDYLNKRLESLLSFRSTSPESDADEEGEDDLNLAQPAPVPSSSLSPQTDEETISSESENKTAKSLKKILKRSKSKKTKITLLIIQCENDIKLLTLPIKTLDSILVSSSLTKGSDSDKLESSSLSDIDSTSNESSLEDNPHSGTTISSTEIGGRNVSKKRSSTFLCSRRAFPKVPNLSSTPSKLQHQAAISASSPVVASCSGRSKKSTSSASNNLCGAGDDEFEEEDEEDLISHSDKNFKIYNKILSQMPKTSSFRPSKSSILYEKSSSGEGNSSNNSTAHEDSNEYYDYPVHSPLKNFDSSTAKATPLGGHSSLSSATSISDNNTLPIGTAVRSQSSSSIWNHVRTSSTSRIRKFDHEVHASSESFFDNQTHRPRSSFENQKRIKIKNFIMNISQNLDRVRINNVPLEDPADNLVKKISVVDSNKLKDEIKTKNRCNFCNKKMGLIGGYVCSCGNIYCNIHRYAEMHDCQFDYKSEGRRILNSTNPQIVSSKIRKI